MDLRLDHICGNEHAKRAAEVAIVGYHSILFLGTQNSEAGALAKITRWAQAECTKRYAEVRSESMSLCPCGLPEDMCCCDNEAIKLHQNKIASAPTDIKVIVARPRTEKIMRWVAQEWIDGEPDEIIKDRIDEARERLRPPFVVDSAMQLLEVAARQLGLEPSQTKSVVSVAVTIAQMAGSERVDAAHMAEAIQYQWRPG